MAAPGNILKNIIGTLANSFQLGIDRALIRSLAGGQVEVRNAADDAYAVLRVAAPVGDNDAVTKYYADSIEKPLIVKRQADCSLAIPNNTATRGWVVVTTAGNGAVVGDILYDDGSGTGTMAIVSAVEGRTIAVTDALTGGTISFEADSIYIWDADGSTWIKIGDIANFTGAVRVIRFAIDNTASQDSTFSVPANARIFETILQVTTEYSAGTTISIGDATTADKFMGTGQNKPQKVDFYSVEQDTDKGTAGVVRVAIAGAPAAGAGVVVVKFAQPNA